MKSKAVPLSPPQILLWDEKFSAVSYKRLEAFALSVENKQEYGLRVQIIDRGQIFEVILEYGNRTITGWLVAEVIDAGHKLEIQGHVGIAPETLFFASLLIVPIFVFSLIAIFKSLAFSAFILAIGLIFIVALVYGIKRTKRELLKIVQNV